MLNIMTIAIPENHPLCMAIVLIVKTSVTKSVECCLIQVSLFLWRLRASEAAWLVEPGNVVITFLV